MVEIPESLQLLFEGSLEADGDRYVVSIPKAFVENGSLSPDESYRIAMLAAATESTDADAEPQSSRDPDSPQSARANESRETEPSQPAQTKEPPVEEGDVRSVVIDTLGDQGDGVARVERGFVVIVSDTKPGDQVDVEITDVKDTVAFAEPVSEATVR